MKRIVILLCIFALTIPVMGGGIGFEPIGGGGGNNADCWVDLDGDGIMDLDEFENCPKFLPVPLVHLMYLLVTTCQPFMYQ